MYLILGIINDMLVTGYYLFVSKQKALAASLTTIILTLLSLFVIEKVIVNTNWSLAIGYAIGTAIGCFVIIIIMKTKKQ
jgi:xanthine/uracil/vitamin C permease (AzgA family)